MTSSSTTSSNEGKGVPEKFGRAMRKAGNIFGIDLAGLFEEEGETQEGFEGFAPTFRITSNLKGRSPSTSTYKAPYQPSRTAEFSLGPRPAGGASIGDINVNIAEAVRSAPAAAAMPAPKKEEKPDRLLASFIGSGSGEAIGAQGIGRAQEYGYSDADIRAKAKQEGIRFGENAARSLGLNTELTSARGAGADATTGALGASAVQRLRDRGLADEAIVSLAKQQGLKFGEAAGQQLGVGQGMMYQAPQAAASSGGGGGISRAASEIKQSFGSSNPAYSGGGSIGEKGIERMAAARGISFAQAREQARSAGLGIGARAAAR